MAHRIQVAKARKDFANVVGRSSRGERIKVTRYGHTLAAIIPKADLEKLEDCEKNGPAPADPKSRESAPSRLARTAPRRNSPSRAGGDGTSG